MPQDTEKVFIQVIKGTARTSSSVEGDDISSRSPVKRSAPSFSKK